MQQQASLGLVAVSMCASGSWMDVGSREEIHPTVNRQGNPLHEAVAGGPV